MNKSLKNVIKKFIGALQRYRNSEHLLQKKLKLANWKKNNFGARLLIWMHLCASELWNQGGHMLLGKICLRRALPVACVLFPAMRRDTGVCE